MRRLTVLLLALAAAPIPAAAAPPEGELDAVIDHAVGEVTQALGRIGGALLDGPTRLMTDLVQLQVDVRDVLRSAEDWLVAWGGGIAPQAPDLTALTASPLPEVRSSGFGWRDDPKTHHRKFHKGTDFRADRGTPVHAAGDGVVAYAGRRDGYGRVIYIDHGGGVITRYAHLAAIEVDAGARVEAGARIGQVGSSGRTTGPHLHFEIRLDGRAVDPVLAMQVADVQRTSPELASVLATALSSAIQDQALDQDDDTNQRRARGERRSSGRRSQALW